ncbi:hypothetical protein PIB30_030321, partial [Stylosanthes scabra]|nr:hypothetical protein [Stylosanthes scabra]
GDCLLPQSFTMHHIHQVPHRVVLWDPEANFIDVRVQRRGNELYFTEGWLDMLIYYNQPNGMWLKLVYFVGGAQFFIEKLYPRNFEGKVQIPTPP